MSSKKRDIQFLKGLGQYRVAPKETTLAIEAFLSSLDHPRALTVWILFKENEHEQIANLDWDPKSYNSLSDARDSYTATKFLSKYPGLALGADLDEAAWLKFREFELLCKNTNARFRNLSSDSLYKGRAVRLHSEVIRKIEKLLGEFSPEEFFKMPDWGPGASTLIKRKDASAAYKFQSEIGITRDLYSLLPLSLMRKIYPHWTRHLAMESTYPCYQVGNKVITVAKDAKTNRVIAVEPGMNLFFQKSIGDMIALRLRRVGVDLRWQSRNQKLAKIGSITGQLATVDLSSASDSISLSVARELLPSRWYTVMDTCRSHYGHFLGQVVKWEKFSSMGNGFTFPLESLIFYAIAKCCVEYLTPDINTVSVYGDDIILPVSAKELFSEMMAFYGFRINERKSHFDSPFRESCGVHYYSGFDLKPLYLQGKLSTIQTVYQFANAVRRLAHRRNGSLGCDAKFQTLFDHLVAKVPKAFRFRIPETLGDGGFIGNLDEATPRRANFGIEGYEVRHVSEVAKCYTEERIGYLLAELWRISEREGGSLPSRERSSMLETLRKIAVRQTLTWNDVGFEGRNSVPLHETRLALSVSIVRLWYDLGPWV